MLNEAQLFRELNDLKQVADETRGLVKAQNGRVRKLEQKVFVQWFLWGGVGTILLVVLPIVVAHLLETAK